MIEKAHSDQNVDLYQQGEETLRERPLDPSTLPPLAETLDGLSPEDIQRLVHELRARQIELEQQNEELRQAHGKLEAMCEKYFSLYDLVPVGYFTISEDGLILEANLTSATMLGVARDDLIEQPFIRFIASEDQDTYHFHCQQFFETQTPQVCEIRLVKKDGAKFYARIEAIVVQDGEGNAPVCQAVVSDISERKQTEETLQASQEYTRNIIESSLDMIITVDRERRIVEFNKAAQQAFGYSLEEVIGAHVDILYADPREGLAIYQKTVETGQCAQEVLNRRRNGQVFPAFLSASVLRDADGELVGVMGVSRDIAESKQAGEILRETNARLNALIEAIPDIVYFKDVQGRNLIVNKAFEKLLGLEKENIVGKTDAQLFPPDLAEQCRRSDEKAIKKRELIRIEEHLTGDEGEQVFFNTVKIPLLDDQANVKGLVGVSRDVSERKRSEEALQQRNLEQETASRIIRALNTLNVGRAFPVLVEGLRNLTTCDRVNLVLLEESGQYFRMTLLGASFPSLEGGIVLPLSATAAAENLATGRPHLTPDLSMETNFVAEQTLYQAGFRSRINLPLLVGGEVIGALNLVSRQLDLFREDQLPVLQQIAGVLASAIENSRLFRIEQRQRQEADTLREVALALTAALTQDEVIERILAQLQQVVPYDTCSVQLFRAAPERGPGEGRLEIVGGRGFPNQPEVVGLFFTLGGDNPNTEVIRTQTSVVVDDAPAEYGDFMIEPHIQAGIRSWLGVPMLVGKRLVGMIALDKKEPGFYIQEHARLAEAFAAQAAVAIENAQLYEAERKWATQLAVVNQVARKAVSILDSDQLLEDIVTAIQQGFEYYNVIFLQLDEKTKELGNQAIAGGFKDLAPPGYRQKIGEGLIGWVAETGRSLLVNDVREDARYIVGFPEGVPTQSELCVPLKLDGRVIGVLDVQETRLNAFDETDLIAMETLADQIAVAIKNAQLYEQAQRDAEMMSVLLNEVNHRVKNNLTGIIGLLYVARSRARVKDQATYQATMDELVGRVRGLASVHSLLSASEWTPLSLGDLAVEIIHAALRALPRDKRISVDVPASPVRVTSDQAHHLALVINELATNVVKYALGGRDKAQITFQVTQDGKLVRCEFRDDGPGYPEDVLQLKRHSVGVDLIQNIVRDSLRGELSLCNDQGAVAVIRFEPEV